MLILKHHKNNSRRQDSYTTRDAQDLRPTEGSLDSHLSANAHSHRHLSSLNMLVGGIAYIFQKCYFSFFLFHATCEAQECKSEFALTLIECAHHGTLSVRLATVPQGRVIILIKKTKHLDQGRLNDVLQFSQLAKLQEHYVLTHSQKPGSQRCATVLFTKVPLGSDPAKPLPQTSSP